MFDKFAIFKLHRQLCVIQLVFWKYKNSFEGFALAKQSFAAENHTEEALGHNHSLQNLLSAARFCEQKETKITDFVSRKH